MADDFTKMSNSSRDANDGTDPKYLHIRMNDLIAKHFKGGQITQQRNGDQSNQPIQQGFSNYIAWGPLSDLEKVIIFHVA